MIDIDTTPASPPSPAEQRHWRRTEIVNRGDNWYTPSAVLVVVDSSPISAIRQLVSDKVRALLARHGISDSREQLTALMSIMDASYSQVYRKASGRASWLEEDLYRIASHFGETLGTLFADDQDAAPPDGHSWQPATIQIDGQPFECQLITDATPGATAPLQVIDTPTGPVVRASAPQASRAGQAVRELRLSFHANPSGGYAVFDDEPDVVDAIVDNLTLKGLRAEGFYEVEALRASQRHFDTYILDWFSGDAATTADLIEYLRTSHAPEATIVILTGKIQQDHAESDLARMIQKYKVLVEIKPMRVELLLAKVAHARAGV
jgi:BetR domain